MQQKLSTDTKISDHYYDHHLQNVFFISKVEGRRTYIKALVLNQRHNKIAQDCLKAQITRGKKEILLPYKRSAFY